MGRWWNIRGGDWGEQGGWTEKRGDWGRERRDWEDDQLDMHRRQGLSTPLADVFSCQWCGKPSEHEQWRPQFCTQTVRSCWTSNGIPARPSSCQRCGKALPPLGIEPLPPAPKARALKGRAIWTLVLSHRYRRYIHFPNVPHPISHLFADRK